MQRAGEIRLKMVSEDALEASRRRAIKEGWMPGFGNRSKNFNKYRRGSFNPDPDNRDQHDREGHDRVHHDA